MIIFVLIGLCHKDSKSIGHDAISYTFHITIHGRHLVKWSFRNWNMSQQTFPVKSQIVNFLDSKGHMVPLAAIQAATGSREKPKEVYEQMNMAVLP